MASYPAETAAGMVKKAFPWLAIPAALAAMPTITMLMNRLSGHDPAKEHLVGLGLGQVCDHYLLHVGVSLPPDGGHALLELVLVYLPHVAEVATHRVQCHLVYFGLPFSIRPER